MKAITLVVGLLVLQISAATRYETISLRDGSPSGFRLILPGTPAAIEAQQKTFLPPAEIRTDNAIFTLKATGDVEDSRVPPAVFRPATHTNPAFVFKTPSQVPQQTFFHVSGPTAHVSGPTAHVFEPTAHVSGPTAHVSRPTAHVFEPTAHVFEPTAHVSGPTAHVSGPTAHVFEPTAHVSGPTAHVSGPTAETSDFIVRNPPQPEVPVLHHAFPQLPELRVVRPLVPTKSQRQQFKISRVPASTIVTDTEFALPAAEVVTAPHTFTVTRAPVSNQATFKHTSRFEATNTESFVSTTHAPRVKPTSPMITLHQFNSQVKPEVNKTEFVDAREVSGESLLDIRGQFREEVTVTPAPVVEVTKRPQRVRVAVTKRVRGPTRKVVGKTSFVATRKSEASLQTQETLRRTPVVEQEVADIPVVHHRQSFVNTASLQKKPAPEFDAEEFERQAQEAEYSFTSAVNDSLSDSALSRHETRKDGTVEGSYSYSDGFFQRTVHYKADHLGYRVISDEVVPLGNGPQPDPEGQAEVALETSSGVHSKYVITSGDIQHPDYEE